MFFLTANELTKMKQICANNINHDERLDAVISQYTHNQCTINIYEVEIKQMSQNRMSFYSVMS